MNHKKKSNEENKPKQKPMETMKMATPEHENKASQTAQSINQSARQTGERAAEQTKRLGETAVEAGPEVTQVGADLLRQNAETLQEAMRLGFEMTTSVMGRSSDQFSRTFDLSGDEKATEHSARNAATTLQTTRAAAQAMSEMSREYSEFVRHQLENARNRMNQFLACRTPQEFAVLQSDFMRDSVQSAVECSRRMVDIMSAKVDDAAKHIRQNTQRPAA